MWGVKSVIYLPLLCLGGSLARGVLLLDVRGKASCICTPAPLDLIERDDVKRKTEIYCQFLWIVDTTIPIRMTWKCQKTSKVEECANYLPAAIRKLNKRLLGHGIVLVFHIFNQIKHLSPCHNKLRDTKIYRTEVLTFYFLL